MIIFKISFKIQTDSKKAKEEFEKRNFQVKNIIISRTIRNESGRINGKEGQEKFEEYVKGKVNEIMQEGKVEKVYITSLDPPIRNPTIK